MGHRGAAGEVLENTLESVSRAVEAGVDMVEVDLRQTADGNLVVFHDANLDRLTGRDLEIETVRWAEISGLEIVAPERAAGRIPLLCDLLDAAPRELPLDLEVKIDRASREGLAKRLLAELRGRERVLVSSFDWTFLALLRRLAPTLPLAPISREDRSGLQRLENPGVPSRAQADDAPGSGRNQIDMLEQRQSFLER